MSSFRKIFFYGKKNCWNEKDFDYPLYINESNQCRLMLLFLYRSDADKWTRDYEMVNSSYDSQRRLYLAWEITSCDYKDYLRVTWLPVVTNFILGVSMWKWVRNGAPRPAREDTLYTNENGPATHPMTARFQNHWRRATPAQISTQSRPGRAAIIKT